MAKSKDLKTKCSMWENDDSRRTELKNFAAKVLAMPNKCSALNDIINKSADLVSGLKSPAATMIEDLIAVMIGDNMLTSRGSGKHYVGNNKNFLGSSGFKDEFRDEYFQTQHAVAGIALGFKYWNAIQMYVRYLENEPQDIKLYDATFSLGRQLTDENYMDLGKNFANAVCLANASNIKFYEPTTRFA